MGQVVVRAQRAWNEGRSYGGSNQRAHAALAEDRPEGGQWFQSPPSRSMHAGPDFESAVVSIRAAVEVSNDAEKANAHAIQSVVLPADRKAHVVGVGNSRLRTLEQKYDVLIDFDLRHTAVKGQKGVGVSSEKTVKAVISGRSRVRVSAAVTEIEELSNLTSSQYVEVCMYSSGEGTTHVSFCTFFVAACLKSVCCCCTCDMLFR